MKCALVVVVLIVKSKTIPSYAGTVNIKLAIDNYPKGPPLEEKNST